MLSPLLSKTGIFETFKRSFLIFELNILQISFICLKHWSFISSPTFFYKKKEVYVSFFYNHDAIMMDTFIWINYLEENNPLYTWSIGKVYFDQWSLHPAPN